MEEAEGRGKAKGQEEERVGGGGKRRGREILEAILKKKIRWEEKESEIADDAIDACNKREVFVCISHKNIHLAKRVNKFAIFIFLNDSYKISNICLF